MKFRHICGKVGITAFFVGGQKWKGPKLLCHRLTKLHACILVAAKDVPYRKLLELQFLQNKMSGTSSNTCTKIHHLYVKCKHRKVNSDSPQGSRPSSLHKHLKLELCLFPPPVANRGLDKWQVLLKRVFIQSHAELPFDTLLEFGGGEEGRGANVEAGRSADYQNISETGKQARHKEVHSCLCVAIKGGFVSWRTWMEEIALKTPQPE